MEKIKKEDILDLVDFMIEKGLATTEDKIEIFENKNIERLKTLCYLLLNTATQEREEEPHKWRKIIESLNRDKSLIKVAHTKRDLIVNVFDKALEEIIGE